MTQSLQDFAMLLNDAYEAQDGYQLSKLFSVRNITETAQVYPKVSQYSSVSLKYFEFLANQNYHNYEVFFSEYFSSSLQFMDWAVLATNRVVEGLVEIAFYVKIN
jgi:hypothetical protein